MEKSEIYKTFIICFIRDYAYKISAREFHKGENTLIYISCNLVTLVKKPGVAIV